MEVIFDTHEFKPVLSPTMRTTLSVLSLIANSLIEANKCMKDRLADEAGQPTTLDQVMQQSGLHIPGLEEALARLMGGSDEAKQAASMIVNTPDPVKLLQGFATQYGFGPPNNEPPARSGPIVTPPASNVAGPAASPGAARAAGLAPFRKDFTREGREAAKASAPSPGATQSRPDLTGERREAQTPVVRPAVEAAGRPSLVGAVARQLDAIRRQRKAHEAKVDARLMQLDAELAKLREEFRELHAALHHVGSKPGEVAGTEVVAASGAVADVAAEAATVDAAILADAGVVADAATATTVAVEAVDAPAVEPLPLAATTEQVVEALELIEAFAEETGAGDQQQLARIAAAEQEVATMRSMVQRAREAQEAATAHA